MRTQAAKMQEADLQWQAELELLEAELTASDQQLAQWQRQSAEQVDAIQTLQRAYHDLASAAVAAAGADATPVLVSALTHRSPDVRLWAVTMLGEIGPAARPAAPALVEALSDESPDVRLAARHALELVDIGNAEDGPGASDGDASMAFGERGQ
jgi:HEAT repeat protein